MFEMEISSNTPKNIDSMFKDKCVLITGATGFLGKVLLEKLLRSCTTISKVLVLIRKNEKHTHIERLQKLFESRVFDRLKKECPSTLDKVHALDGDVTQTNFALDEAAINMVNLEVNFVFHCAASVRFENIPRKTLMINFIGVLNMMRLCEKIINLSAVIHVSTAYSFCNQEIICEQLYEETFDVESLEILMNIASDDVLEAQCLKVGASRPSLYQYSKAMAEIYIAENCGNLPVIIVRPSVITAAASEPFPGWIDNYNGPSGFIALSSKGIIKTVQVKPSVNADWVPVDLVANTLIVAAYHTAVRKEFPNTFVLPLNKKSAVPIVNCVCPKTNSITWLNVVQTCIPLLHQYPSMHVYRVPGGNVTSSKDMHMLCRYFYHYLPAAILDMGMLLLWKERRFVRNYQRIHKVFDYLQHYTTNEFVFKSKNMKRLVESVNDTDQSTFPINQNLLNWQQYLEDYVHGVRLFFLKEEDSTLPKARQRLALLKLLYFLAKVSPAIMLLLILKRRLPGVLPSLNLASLNFTQLGVTGVLPSLNLGKFSEIGLKAMITKSFKSFRLLPIA